MSNPSNTTRPNVASIIQNSLTPEQYAAATDRSREVLCLACAGSGKSQTLAFRIARLVGIDNVDPASIVAFTFTEKAAESIKQRVAQALTRAGIDASIVGAMYIGTIHAYCQRVLGEMDATYRQFEVLDENRLKLFLISRYSQLHIPALRTGRHARYFEAVKQVSDAWLTANDELIDLTEITLRDAVLGRVLESLDERMRESQFIDFSLMIRRVVDALKRNDARAEKAISNLRHLMVDEYQDVDRSQELLIEELHKRSETLFAVGDDDQAIYNFRGADVTNILNFHNVYPNCTSHTLSTNFRSTAAIVETSDGFISAELGASRIVKNPKAAQLQQGARDLRRLWFETREDEATWIAERIKSLLGSKFEEKDGSIRGLTPADFAILLRSTKGGEQDGSARHTAFTDKLNRLGIPFTLGAGGSVFDRPQVNVLRETFELFRDGNPNRNTATQFFQGNVTSVFPQADISEFIRVLSEWGRRIHMPTGGTRQRLRPQQLVHDLLSAYHLADSSFDDATMQDIGVFSRIMQDVEAVYVSVDSSDRFTEILNFLGNIAETGYDSSTVDILSRPDAVTVSTVHQMKGLEFPAVFVADVEASRFPVNRSNYDGWLPPDLLQSAITRGAYRNTLHGEARLFYTALTRAERYLHVTGSSRLPNARQTRKPSPFSLRLSHSELSEDLVSLPPGLTRQAPKRRIDETVVPTSFSKIRYYLSLPFNPQQVTTD